MSGRFVVGAIYGFALDDEWSFSNLLVNRRNVFTDDTEKDKLNSGKKEYRYDDRRNAGSCKRAPRKDIQYDCENREAETQERRQHSQEHARSHGCVTERN